MPQQENFFGKPQESFNGMFDGLRLAQEQKTKIGELEKTVKALTELKIHQDKKIDDLNRAIEHQFNLLDEAIALFKEAFIPKEFYPKGDYSWKDSVLTFIKEVNKYQENWSLDIAAPFEEENKEEISKNPIDTEFIEDLQNHARRIKPGGWKKYSWQDFRDTGLLLFINQLLHIFGWSIMIAMENGKIIDVYPARVGFRGFPERNVDEAYVKITKFLKGNIKFLDEEINESE